MLRRNHALRAALHLQLHAPWRKTYPTHRCVLQAAMLHATVRPREMPRSSVQRGSMSLERTFSAWCFA